MRSITEEERAEARSLGFRIHYVKPSDPDEPGTVELYHVESGRCAWAGRLHWLADALKLVSFSHELYKAKMDVIQDQRDHWESSFADASGRVEGLTTALSDAEAKLEHEQRAKDMCYHECKRLRQRMSREKERATSFAQACEDQQRVINDMNDDLDTVAGYLGVQRRQVVQAAIQCSRVVNGLSVAVRRLGVVEAMKEDNPI